MLPNNHLRTFLPQEVPVSRSCIDANTDQPAPASTKAQAPGGLRNKNSPIRACSAIRGVGAKRSPGRHEKRNCATSSTGGLRFPQAVVSQWLATSSRNSVAPQKNREVARCHGKRDAQTSAIRPVQTRWFVQVRGDSAMRSPPPALRRNGWSVVCFSWERVACDASISV